MKMITCTQCGKLNGYGEVGTSWVCGDCKVEAGDPAALAGGEQDAGSGKRSNDRDVDQEQDPSE